MFSCQYNRALSSIKMLLLLKLSFSLSVCVTLIFAYQNPQAVNVKDVGHKVDVNYRLPNLTHPISYDLSVFTRVDQSNFDFNGYVKIDVGVDYTTRGIVLHAGHLNITNVRVSRYSGTMPIGIRLLPYTHNNDTQFLSIQTDGSMFIPGDRLLVEISYAATLRTDNSGFYRTSYVDDKGSRRQVQYFCTHQIFVIDDGDFADGLRSHSSHRLRLDMPSHATTRCI